MKNETISESMKLNDTLKIIYDRRAIRKYKDKPVEIELIERIIDAGRMAPSAMNRQSWKFHVLTNTETIKAFSKEIVSIAAKKFIKTGLRQIIKSITSMFHFSAAFDVLKSGDPVFYGAPVVIFISAPVDNEWAELDIGMCSQNMMLAAKSIGLDSCPIGFGKFIQQTKIFSRLKIPETEQVYFSIILGYGDENPEMHKRIRENVFYID
jgi:nitroreductase